MAPIATKDIINSDGYSISGKVISKRKLSQATTESWAAAGLSEEHDLVLKTFRLLIADLCQQFKGGHPG
jgi:dihydroxyacetone synthase